MSKPAAAGGAQSREAILKNPILRTLLQLAWPATLATLLHEFSQMATSYWMAHLVGTAGVAAIGLFAPIHGILGRLMLLAPSGTEVLVAQSVGRQDGQGIRILANGVYLTIVMAITLAAVCLVGMTGLVESLTGDAELQSTLRAYVIPYLILFPFVSLIPTLNAVVAGSGWTRFALIRQSLILLLNTGFLPLFIAVFAFGVSGAPMANALVSILLGLITWLALRQRRRELPLGTWTRDAARVDRGLWKRILGIGVAPALSQAAEFAALFVVFRFVAEDGKSYVAGFHNAMLIFFLGGSPCRTFAQATGTMIAQNVGAKQLARARTVFRTGLLVAFVAGGLLVLPLGHMRFVAELLSDDPAVVENALRALDVLRFAILPLALFQLLRDSFNAVARNKVSNFVLIACSVLMVVLPYVLPFDRIEAAGLAILISNAAKVVALGALWFAARVLPRSEPE